MSNDNEDDTEDSFDEAVRAAAVKAAARAYALSSTTASRPKVSQKAKQKKNITNDEVMEERGGATTHDNNNNDNNNGIIAAADNAVANNGIIDASDNAGVVLNVGDVGAVPQIEEAFPPQMYEGYEGDFDFEVVGLDKDTNGCSCCQHKICGKHLMPRDIVRLARCVVDVGWGPEEATKVVRIMDGVEGCTVGFVPRQQANMPKIRRAIGQFAQVMDIYNYSQNATKKHKSLRNGGMCCCLLLSSIQERE